MIRSAGRRRTSAFSIVETVFSVLLVSGVLVAALNSAGAAATGRRVADGRARGQLLAESLLTEIMARAYQDEDKLANLGLETGESAANRQTWDDVDDYRNHTDSPPTRVDGVAIAGFDNWSRSVSVVRVNPANPNTLAVSELGLKRITVTVKRRGTTVATLTGFKTSSDPVSGKSRWLLNDVVDLIAID